MIRRTLVASPWFGALAAALGALVVLLVGLDARSLWFDEAMSVRAADLRLDQFFAFAFDDEAFTGLYYSLLKVWIRVTGDGVWLVRLPSALFAAAAVGFTYLVGRRLLGTAAGVAAAVILALHAALIQYGQEARTYALAGALVTAATWAFLVAGERRAWRWWAAYAVLAIAAVYAHFFAAMVVAGHAVAFALHPDRRRLPWRQALVAWATTVVGAAPLGLWLLVNDQTRNWIQDISPARVVSVLAWLGGGSAIEAPGTRSALAAAAATVVVVSAVVALATARRRPLAAWGWSVPLAWALIPLVGGAIASVVLKPVLADRYMFVVLPALALLAGGLVMAPRWSAARVAAAVLAALVLAVGTTQVFSTELKKPEWREAVAIIGANEQPGDAVITEPGWQWVPLSYALRQAEPVPSVQRIVTNPAIAEPAVTLAESAQQHPRVWLLVVDGRASPHVESYAYLELLQRSYHLVEARAVHRIGVFLFERAS